VFKRWVARGQASVALVEIGAFVAVLAFGLGYVWRRGDLAWLRDLRREGDRGPAPEDER